jgi:hypothetical protein
MPQGASDQVKPLLHGRTSITFHRTNLLAVAITPLLAGGRHEKRALDDADAYL